MKHAFFRRLRKVIRSIARFLAYVVSMLSRKRKRQSTEFHFKSYTVDEDVGRKESDHGKSDESTP